MKYEYIDDLTSDVMFRAYGKDSKELFENAALALSGIFCDIEKVKEEREANIEAEGADIKELMINWLNMVLATVDIEEMFFKRFEVTEISDTKIKAKVFGQDIAPELGKTVAKAVTYYNYKLETEEKGMMVQAVIDI